jgi:hypothetical protein
MKELASTTRFHPSSIILNLSGACHPLSSVHHVLSQVFTISPHALHGLQLQMTRATCKALKFIETVHAKTNAGWEGRFTPAQFSSIQR